jgi:hypothetical protein
MIAEDSIEALRWFLPMARTWGKARRKLMRKRHDDLQSIFGKITEGWSIAACLDAHYRPTPPGALTGKALEVHVAIQRAIAARTLTERQHQVFFAHYVVKDERWPPKRKALFLGLSRQQYYERLKSAYKHIIRAINDVESVTQGDNVPVDSAA